ncbi:MAG TPA: hypothetical protein VHX52_00285 [Steroidobacteraceae bacterium]|nr:hypothetical protein [Steroidobacteraceae bacterium]
MLLQACLGVSIDAWSGEVSIDRPRLPTDVDHLTVENLEVGAGRVTLHLHRVDHRVVAFAEARAGAPVSVLVHA